MNLDLLNEKIQSLLEQEQILRHPVPPEPPKPPAPAVFKTAEQHNKYLEEVGIAIEQHNDRIRHYRTAYHAYGAIYAFFRDNLVRGSWYAYEGGFMGVDHWGMVVTTQNKEEDLISMDKFHCEIDMVSLTQMGYILHLEPDRY